MRKIQTRSLSWLLQMAIGVQPKVVEGSKVPSWLEALYLIEHARFISCRAGCHRKKTIYHVQMHRR